METGTVFINNRTQAVRLPASTRFPDSVKRVQVRIVGKDRVLTPVESAWDSFFLNGIEATEDFLTERPDQTQKEREQL